MKRHFGVVVVAALAAVAAVLPMSAAFAGNGMAPKAGSATNGTKPEDAAGSRAAPTAASKGTGTLSGSKAAPEASQVGTKTPGGIIGK